MNVASLIDGHADDVVALISRNRETTYGQLRDQVARLRGGLAARGVGAGDRVAILCGNNRYFVVSYFAIVGLGAVAVPLNPTSPGPELQQELAAIDACAVVVGPAARPCWAKVDRSALPTVRFVVHAEGESGDDGDADVDFDDLLGADPVPAVEVDPTTSRPCCSPVAPPARPGRHAQPRQPARQHRARPHHPRSHHRRRRRLRGAPAVPHLRAQRRARRVDARRGHTAARPAVRPGDRRAVDRAARCHGGAGRAPHVDRVQPLRRTARRLVRNVRLALSGASRLSPGRGAERFAERFGVEIQEGYGLTEAAPVVTSSSGIPNRPGSVGKALVGIDIRLVGDDGGDVPVGDAGEIWVRATTSSSATGTTRPPPSGVLVDGWLRTGDIAVTDEDGYLYLVDRAKDLIIVSGFNVFPAEVEAVLVSHPDVVEAGVLGVPHPHHGEAVKAYVVATPGSHLDEDALIDYSMEYLSGTSARPRSSSSTSCPATRRQAHPPRARGHLLGLGALSGRSGPKSRRVGRTAL
jgi:long-chain acyl-CoA synthetase